MTQVAATELAAPAVVQAGSLQSSIKVEQLTCAIGAELSNVNLGVASRDNGPGRRDPRAAAEAHACCSSATRTSRAPSTSPSRGTSASSRTIRSPAAIRRIRAWCASTSRPRRRTTVTRTPGIPTRPGARSRRSAACCAASSARRSAATRCGPTWCSPMRSCPSTSRRRSPGCARATASKPPSAPRCRSRSAWR